MVGSDSIAIDTETTGLDHFHGCKAFLITTCEEGNQTWWETTVDPLTRDAKFSSKDLQSFKKYILEFKKWYFQNPVFDITFLALGGAPWILDYWDRVRDIGIASHLCNSGLSSRDLTTLTLIHKQIDLGPIEKKLGRQVQKAQNYCRRNLKDWDLVPVEGHHPKMPSNTGGKKWKADMWLLPLLEKEHPEIFEKLELEPGYYLEYANADSAATRALGIHLEEIIQQRNLQKIYQKRLELLPVIYSIQSRGMSLSKQRTLKLQRKYNRESEILGNRCIKLAKTVGIDLTLPKNGNNKSLLDTVFKGFKVEPVKRSPKTGEPSLDTESIKEMMDNLSSREPAYRFLENLKEKRSRDTASNTYLTGYQRSWRRIRPHWYKLHPSINPVGTSTLRWSSSNPNGQNISKREGFNLRYSFGPYPGREWWSIDAKNIELRLPAYESKEQDLIDLFEKSEEPPYYGSEHLLNFSTVYEDIWNQELERVGIERVGLECKEKYKSTYYRRCKNGGFAMGYGAIEKANGQGTADKAFGRPGSQAKLKSRFSKKEQLNKQCILHAQRYGYVETIIDKDIDPDRGYPIECPFNDSGRVKPTVPLNYHIQSTAMQWMWMAMIRVYHYLDSINKEKYGLSTEQILNQQHKGKLLDIGYFLIMQVHDELLFDFPKGTTSNPQDDNMEIIQEVARLMELGGKGISIPTPVSIEYHPDNWSEGVEVHVQR